MHADWLRVPFDSPLREELKRTYGCFAGKEADALSGVTRRSGIPALVVVGPDGEELEFDAAAAVRRGGGAALRQWSGHAWPSA